MPQEVDQRTDSRSCAKPVQVFTQDSALKHPLLIDSKKFLICPVTLGLSSMFAALSTLTTKYLSQLRPAHVTQSDDPPSKASAVLARA